MPSYVAFGCACLYRQIYFLLAFKEFFGCFMGKLEAISGRYYLKNRKTSQRFTQGANQQLTEGKLYGLVYKGIQNA